MAEPLYKNSQKIFSDSPKFVVPPYQREYSWQSVEIDQLLTDLDLIELDYSGADEIDPQSPHFLGLLVFIDEKDNSGQTVYSLVDGQQRLSTIVLISAVAKDVIKEKQKNPEIKLDDSNDLTKVYGFFDDFIYRSSRPFGKKTPRLEPNKSDKDLFNLLVLEEGSLEDKKENIVARYGKSYLRKKYFLAYKHIYEYLIDKIDVQGVRFIADFFVRINAGILFIPFVAQSDTDAFMFETLNDRGLNLSALDLIKNRVLQKASDDELDDFDATWQEIFGREGIVPNRQSQAFIRNFLMLKIGHVSSNKVFDVCKSYLKI